MDGYCDTDDDKPINWKRRIIMAVIVSVKMTAGQFDKVREYLKCYMDHLQQTQKDAHHDGDKDLRHAAYCEENEVEALLEEVFS